MLFPSNVRRFVCALVLTFCVLPLQSATLERLSLDNMIQKATAIVRATVTGSHVAQQGPLIYTHYTIHVTERFKGPAAASVDIVVPGGTLNNLRQSFAGTPSFRTGDDYVFFLWTGPSGLTHIIGLTQGLFAMSRPSSGNPVATRTASSEVMLDRATGHQVKDQTLVMNLSDLRSRIAKSLSGAGN
ncbi:MAG TPA: hypothetical protein VH640_13465 [Bryobacteraceae bacterium]|jgi:hypothetical protein